MLSPGAQAVAPVHSIVVESVAPAPLSATVPSGEGAALQPAKAPSKNVTVPVAVDGETVALSVTFPPHEIVLALEDMAITEGRALIVSVTAADVLLA